MNSENTEKLCEKFPELYNGQLLGMKQDLMCFDFECDDGWFEILHRLSREIMEHCRETGEPVPLAMQEKEKFGELRFYVGPTSVEIIHIIEHYTKESRSVCEMTGKPGKIRTINGWLKTLCEEEYEKVKN
ncbi:MAG: hypothetical protein EOM62_09880 [Bacteroidia bacterium]|nr:hypothetical protein [Bacteroidia bacterium]